MDFIVSTVPIVILIYLMTKKNSVPSHVALFFAFSIKFLTSDDYHAR